jgi:hypothetical protein
VPSFLVVGCCALGEAGFNLALQTVDNRSIRRVSGFFHDPHSGLAEVLAGARFLGVCSGRVSALFSSWLACRCDLSSLVRFFAIEFAGTPPLLKVRSL